MTRKELLDLNESLEREYGEAGGDSVLETIALTEHALTYLMRFNDSVELIKKKLEAMKEAGGYEYEGQNVSRHDGV